MVSRDAAVLGDPLAAVTVCLDDDTRGLLNLFTEKDSLVRLRRHLERYPTDEQELTGDLSADIYLVDFDRDRQRATQAAEEIHAADLDAAIFAVSAQSAPDSIIQAMRCGCSEYIWSSPLIATSC